MAYDFDVCIIGSGAGGGPIAYEMSKAGFSVVVLEKGSWFKEKDFTKDELLCCRRSVYTPNLRDEKHVIEEPDGGGWRAESTEKSGRDFWNGSMVGGSSNLMSGYFMRLKPNDFRLLSEYGPISGANIVDWPITYDDLEPYYAKTERLVGVSGKIINHPNQEPRSDKDFPFPPTIEHPVSAWIDDACAALGYHSLPTARAILSRPAMDRNSCAYTNYCGSYGCTTGAKGSSRAALLDPAIKTGFCEIRAQAMARKLVTDKNGKVTHVEYYDKERQLNKVNAKIYIIACQAIESARLLLNSTGDKHPNGLGNRFGQVGKNLLFSGGGSGGGDLPYGNYSAEKIERLKVRGLFVNRSLQDWYYIHNRQFSKRKGGTIDFLFRHANAVSKANNVKWGGEGLVWGEPLKKRLKAVFTEGRRLQFEIFNDWLPTDDCFVSLDPHVKDKWGNPAARIRVGYHEQDLRVGRFLAEKAEKVLRQLGAENIGSGISGSPPPNLVAGGCRFGKNPETSVLDKNCRIHDVENVYVTDGGFMPTGGSVPYTWTIYANSFRVADYLKQSLGR